MIRLLLIFTFYFCLLISYSQEDKDIKRSRLPQYRAISPLITDFINWADWESTRDSVYKMNEVEKYKDPNPVNFIGPNYDDEDTLINYIPIRPGSLHCIDYNNDGDEDIIYTAFISMTEGTKVKFLRNAGDGYIQELYLYGSIIEMKEYEDGTLGFTLHVYPCCDGYVNHLKKYALIEENGEMHYALVEKHTLIQSTMSQMNNIPRKLILKRNIEPNTMLINDAVCYYRDKRPVYQKFDVPENLAREHTLFHPFAIFSKGAQGEILTEYGDRNNDKSTMLLIRFAKGTQPQIAIRHLNWQSRKEESDSTYYYGWIDSRDCSLTSTSEITHEWKRLCRKGGCLTGGQYCRGEKCGNPACVLNYELDWQIFLKRPRNELVPFLLDQFSDTSQTQIHTCPFFNATKGELAVYCLQHVFKTNWYNLDKEFREFLNREVNETENMQIWLQDILKDAYKCSILKQHWKKIWDENSEFN